MRLLTIIDRYLLREIVQTWLAVTLVLLLVLISNSLVVILSKAVDGSLPSDAILPLFLTYILSFLVTLIPLGLYLGIMLGFGRLYKDSEMSALTACGIGGWQFYRPVLICAAFAVAIILSLTLWASPWASRLEHQVMHQLKQRSELSNLTAGRFNESQDGRSVLFSRQINRDGDQLEGVFLHSREKNGQLSVEVAKQARLSDSDASGRPVMLFEEGRRYLGKPGQLDYQVIEFEKHGVVVPGNHTAEGLLEQAAKPSSQLWRSDDIHERAELQWRLMLPLAALILALMAVPLSQTTPRKGRYAKLGWAVLFYVPYSNLVVLSKKWMANGATPDYLGMWWVQLLAFLVAMVMIVRMNGFAWFKLLLSRRVPR